MRTLSTIASLCGLLLVLFTAPNVSAKDDWRTIDPYYLKQATPQVDKDADAETVLWEIRVEKETEKAVVTHYILIKIFNDRGRESQSKIDIPYFDNIKIDEIAARTIKPDGSISISGKTWRF